MLEISICIGTSCHLNGAYNVVQTFQQLIEEASLHDQIDIKACFCMRKCQNDGVSVAVGEESFRVTPEEAGEFFKNEIIKRLPSLFEMPL
jgi:NADH:ubiquinone oxidoreductase subunit E